MLVGTVTYVTIFKHQLSMCYILHLKFNSCDLMRMILSLRLLNLSEYISQKKLLSQNARVFVCPRLLLYLTGQDIF